LFSRPSAADHSGRGNTGNWLSPLFAAKAIPFCASAIDLGFDDLEARGVGGNDVSALEETVLHNPIDDGAPALQQNISSAVTVEVTGPNHVKAGGVGGNDVSALEGTVLHNPIDDGATALQQNISGAVTVEVTGPNHVKAGGVGGNDVSALEDTVLHNPIDDRAPALQ
jgi:hypothetical protein